MNRLIATATLVFAAFLLPLPQSHAQWQQTFGPGGGVTTALYAKGDLLFAGNFEHYSLTNTDPDAGTLYRSTDHGLHWAPSNIGFTGVPNSFASNATSLFVATSTNGIFRSMDDGATWSALNGTNSLSPVNLLYVNGVLYVGSGVTGVYRSTDNGNTFVASSNGLPPNNPRSIGAMVNIGSTLFIGISTNYPNPYGVYRSMDGGANWVQLNNGLGQHSINDLAVKGATLFAATAGLTDGGVYKSTDLGASWTLSNTGISGQPEVLHAAGDGSLYVSVFRADYTGRSRYRSTDDGASWSLTGPGIPVNETTEAFASIGAEVYAGLGLYGSVYRTIDSGASWQPANIGLPEVDVKTIFPSGSSLFSGSLSVPGIHRSTDGGETWLPSATGLPEGYKTVTAFGQNSSYLFAAVDYFGIYRSSDSGAHWQPAGIGLTASVHGFAALGEDIYAATEDGVYKTTNNGAQWTVASPTINGSRPQVQTVVVLGGRIFAGTSINGIFKSSDAGATWTQSNIGISAGVGVYFLTVRGADLIAGTGAGVYLSQNNGATWSPRSTGLPAGWARTVAAQGNTLVTAIYDPTLPGSRGVFISTNSGTSWSAYYGGIGLNAVRTLAISNNRVFAGTETYSIWSAPLSTTLAMPTSVVSRKTHGSAGAFDLNLPLTGTPGIECRSGGATNDYQVVFTFPSAVTFNIASVTSGSGSVSSSGGSGTTTVIVNLTGVINAQRITVTLLGVNNAGDVSVPMGVLVGDTNGDSFVNSGDALQTRNRSGQVTDATNFRSDVNTDGFVNSGDTLAVRNRSGTFLP